MLVEIISISQPRSSVAVCNRTIIDSAVQSQHQYNSKGGEGHPVENRALRELIKMRKSSSSSYDEDEDAKRTQRLSRCSNSLITDREAEAVSECGCGVQAIRCLNLNADAAAFKASASSGSRYHGHIERHPFGSRAQAKAKAKSPSTSHINHERYDADPDSTPLPPPLPFVFVKDTSSCARRPHRLKRQNIFGKSKGIKLNDLQVPPPPRRLTQTQTSQSDADVNAVEAATSQLRKMCMDIIRSAEEGIPPPPRDQIKKVVADYHRRHNNPISPRDPNFIEIPPECSKVLTYGLARSQTALISTNYPSLTRRSRFSEVKDEGQQINESRLHTTVEVGPSDVESSVSLPSTIDDVFSV